MSMAPIEFPTNTEINFSRLLKLKFNTKNGNSAMQCLNPNIANAMIQKKVIITFFFKLMICIHTPHNKLLISNEIGSRENTEYFGINGISNFVISG